MFRSAFPAIFAAAALATAAPASAQPPAAGWVGPLQQPSILCDTPAQLRDIVEAFADSEDAGLAKFSELYLTVNGRSEPTCAITMVQAAEAGDAIHLGQLEIGGTALLAWILPVSNDVGTGVYLYLESQAERLSNSI
jgi:hypothetical protein